MPTTRPDLAEPRVRRLVLAGAVAVVLIAGALGWLFGGVLHGDGTAPARAGDRGASVGVLQVVVDGNWTPSPPAKELGATRLADLSAFAPVVGLPGRTWLARAPIDGPTLLPAALRARVTAVPAPEKARLAGHAAWRYPAMDLRGGGLLEVTALPTTAGVLLVGCEADKTSWSSVAGCGAAVHEVGGAPMLAPSATLAFRARLRTVVAKLNARRAAAGAALRRARHVPGQRAAAQRLAQASRVAASALGPLAPATGPARDAVTRLNASAAAYGALARAAARRDRPAYRRARQATAREDRALAAALAGAAR